MNKFSIVIPVYNEAKNLRILIPRIYQVLKNEEFELIIVDDSSTDNTTKLLKKCKKKNFYYIIRKSNRDLSKSCVLGFKKSKYKNIIVMDGDLQHKPSDIKKFLYVFRIKNPDIVVGTRNLFKYKKHNLNASRLFASRALILIVNLLLENKTSDPMSGFFMFKKEIFLKSEKKLINKGYKILLDLLYISNQKIKVYDVSIDFDSRSKGKSKMSMKILIYLIFMIVRKFISRILF